MLTANVFHFSRPKLTALALLTLVAGCGPGSSPTQVTLNVLRNGKPVEGIRTIFQRESDQGENGSGVSDANGVVVSTDTSENLMVTLVNPINGGSARLLYTMRDLSAGANIEVNLPPANDITVGIVAVGTLPVYPGADIYTIAILTNGGDPATYFDPTKVAANTPITIAVNQNEVDAAGKVTVVALAKKSPDERLMAFSILKNVPIATVGPTTAAVNFGPWNGNVTGLTLQLTDTPAGAVAPYFYGYLEQFTAGFPLYALTTGLQLPAMPADIKVNVIPGLSDEYVMSATLDDSTNGTTYDLLRTTATLTSLSTWSPGAVGLPMISKIKLDQLSPVSAPRISWTQASTAIGVANAGMLTATWITGGIYTSWQMLASPTSMDGHSYQFPKLPAADADLAPPSGTLFGGIGLYYINNSTVTDYTGFVEQLNFSFVNNVFKPGQIGDTNTVKTFGSP